MPAAEDESGSEGGDLLAAFREKRNQREKEALLADFFTRTRPRLYAMVELRLDKRLRGRLSPSDVIQDAYLEAAKRLPKYLDDPELPFFLWVRRVTADKLYDLHREHLGAKGRDVRREEAWEHGSAGLGASSAVLAKKLAAEKASPSEAAAASERRKALADALEEMDPLDREVIALRAFEMLSVPEAARVLGVRPGAARTRYWRALKKLKALLEDKGQHEEAE